MSLQSDSARQREVRLVCISLSCLSYLVIVSVIFTSKQVLCRTSRLEHPASKFGWGNAKSLEEDVKARGYAYPYIDMLQNMFYRY
jgi:hypothetical protein